MSDPALDEVYAERNAVVLAFATLAAIKGWPVGYANDDTEPDWPVLLIETPMGQLSWHVKADELPPEVPPFRGRWDGHDSPEKYARLRRLVDISWTGAPLAHDAAMGEEQQ